jgi:hypothetical protein
MNSASCLSGQAGVLKKPSHSQSPARNRKNVCFAEKASFHYYDTPQTPRRTKKRDTALQTSPCIGETDGESLGLQDIPAARLFRILDLARSRDAKHPPDLEKRTVVAVARRNKHAESSTQTIGCKDDEAVLQKRLAKLEAALEHNEALIQHALEADAQLTERCAVAEARAIELESSLQEHQQQTTIDAEAAEGRAAELKKKWKDAQALAENNQQCALSLTLAEARVAAMEGMLQEEQQKAKIDKLVADTRIFELTEMLAEKQISQAQLSSQSTLSPSPSQLWCYDDDEDEDEDALSVTGEHADLSDVQEQSSMSSLCDDLMEGEGKPSDQHNYATIPKEFLTFVKQLDVSDFVGDSFNGQGVHDDVTLVDCRTFGDIPGEKSAVEHLALRPSVWRTSFRKSDFVHV